MRLTTVLENIVKNGISIVKVLRGGKSDIQTGLSVVPFGIDCNIPKDYVAVYAHTDNENKIILGIVHRKALAKTGELRLFSLKNNNALSASIWLKDNQEIEIGNSLANESLEADKIDYAVKYNKLKEELDKTNAMITAITDSLTNWQVTPQDGGLALKTLWTTNSLLKTLGNYSSSKHSKIIYK